MNLSRLLALPLIFILPLAMVATARAATPYETLDNIGQAIDSGDGETFARLVDLDNILRQSLDAFIKESSDASVRSKMPAVVGLIVTQMADPGQTGTTLKNLFLSESKGFVLNGVESGAFAGKQLKSSPANGMLAPLFSNISMGRKEIRGIGDGMKAGENMIVPFSIHDYGNGNDYVVLGKFVPLEEGWQLASIENLDELFNQILTEAAE